jgi:hypothetical protein
MYWLRYTISTPPFFEGEGSEHRAFTKSRKSKELDYAPLLPRALRAIRFGILPSQSGFRRNDEQRVPMFDTFALY